MRQPVSRISFDRRRGFLGVQLQEGALFVDAAWNEASDIAWSQLRDAIVAGGVAGSAGRELRIAPQTAPGSSDGGDGKLTNLIVCGTSHDGRAAPRPFYCDGLPVLWPADLAIDQQAPLYAGFAGDTFAGAVVPAGASWIELLQPDQRYQIYVRAHVATLDRLDDPFLDDPGLDAARGSFRKRVATEVRLRKAPSAPAVAPGTASTPIASNVQLTVDGSYTTELNVLYRVELVAPTGLPGAPAASLLWDPDAAATVARVVDDAVAGARLVMVDSTAGFAAGFVRFEAPGVSPELYRVTQAPGFENAAIQVTRHRCDRAERSLAAWQVAAPVDSSPGGGQFIVKLSPPAPVQAGDVLRCLPEGLHVGWSEAQVIAVSAFDARRNAVTVSLQQATNAQLSTRALAIADWQATGPAVANTDGSYTAELVAPPAIAAGDVVTALPAQLGTPDSGPWAVIAAPLPPVPDAGQPVAPFAITLGPAGLSAALSTLDLAHKASLEVAAHAFDTTLTVALQPGWKVGDQVTIMRGQDEDEPISADAIATREQRTIVRIDRLAGGSAGGGSVGGSGASSPTMLVRLDQPLAYDHAAGVEEVVPVRLIRARRFAGHACQLGIDIVDPHDGPASVASFAHGQPLADGLALHLSTDKATGVPSFDPGQGWHFAARSDGWVETKVFAPVEEPPASEVVLAELTVSAGGFELIDCRPLPAAFALDDELAQLAAAAGSITGLPAGDPAASLLADIARLAGYPRVQPALLDRLKALAGVAAPSRLAASPACRPWLDRLGQAVAQATAAGDREPSRRALAAIGFALAGLAFAFSALPMPQLAGPAPARVPASPTRPPEPPSKKP